MFGDNLTDQKKEEHKMYENETRDARWSEGSVRKAIDHFLLGKNRDDIALRLVDASDKERNRVIWLANKAGYEAEFYQDDFVRIFNRPFAGKLIEMPEEVAS